MIFVFYKEIRISGDKDIFGGSIPRGVYCERRSQ